MTSMPALPNVLNRSSSSSEDVISDGSSSLTSSYRRYPFSFPMLISWRTSSYFSSIDILRFPREPPARPNRAEDPASRDLREFLDALCQLALTCQQRVDL